ncbi:MAG TPA: DegT/DnrJ/EryC1/StrS family aminotransferase, partial [Legionellaceae bacterium]|nr:DegT/DnrJ/EryC1/StrS family aminotransferase [Legionellaceae bacterium]
GMYATSSILTIGAVPFFMDVDPNHFCVTLAEVMRAVESGVKAIVVTHLYGQMVPDIAQIAQYCKTNNIRLLEDCAQAHGAEMQGRYAGSFGDAASFSFYPTKNLGALGDGGAVVTDDAHIAEQTRLLSQYGWTTKYKVEIPGARNSRLDEMQAAILSDLLPFLDETNAKRRAIAERYNRYITHPQISLPSINGKEYVAHLYVIKSPRRDALRDYLRQCSIMSEVHYPIPDYRQPLFNNRYGNHSLQHTELLSTQILTLPCYPEMNDERVDHIIEMINGWQG